MDYFRRQHDFSRWAGRPSATATWCPPTSYSCGGQQAHGGDQLHEQPHQDLQADAAGRNKQCITELEKDLVLKQAYIPLATLPGVLPSLRSGDIFALVTKVLGLDVTHVGFLEKRDGVVNAIHAAEGAG